MGLKRWSACLAAAVVVGVTVTVPVDAAPAKTCRRVRVVVPPRRKVRYVLRCIAAPPVPKAPRGTPPPSPLSQAYLTRDGADAFSYLPTATGFVAVGDFRNSGGNTRVLLWDDRALPQSDATTCTTFSDTGVPAQEGIAMRIRTSGASVRALTVTKNVYFGETRLLNVHTWDTSRPGDPWSLVQQVNLTQQLGVSPMPWRICAQAAGDMVVVKVWGIGTPEPSWTSSGLVRRIALPSGWAAPGKFGVYVGHLRAGKFATYADTTVGPLPTAPPPPPTTTSTTTTSTTSTTTTTVP